MMRMSNSSTWEMRPDNITTRHNKFIDLNESCDRLLEWFNLFNDILQVDIYCKKNTLPIWVKSLSRATSSFYGASLSMTERARRGSVRWSERRRRKHCKFEFLIVKKKDFICLRPLRNIVSRCLVVDKLSLSNKNWVISSVRMSATLWDVIDLRISTFVWHIVCVWFMHFSLAGWQFTFVWECFIKIELIVQMHSPAPYIECCWQRERERKKWTVTGELHKCQQ